MSTNRKTRKDCFFGLHFDFHATTEMEPIGVTNREKFAAYLDAVKPDFVQMDTKGHPGYASFFSEYGTVAPGLKIDQLKMIREETKKRGILLYAHYSGVKDVRACTEHPTWGIVTKEGKLTNESTDLTSPYVDEVLIPQLCELAGKYGLDGAWVDGEIWAVHANYRSDLVEDFKKKTGYTEISSDPSHPSNVEYRTIFRNQFVDYIRKYTKAIHAKYPDFEITSNYCCSEDMAEKTLVDDLDFLSADFCSPLTSRLTSRCLAGQNKTWDLLAWAHRGFWSTPKGSATPRTIKNIKRMCRECAMVIAPGAGYHIVHSMTLQGEVRDTERELMTQLSEFARARQKFCHHGKPLKSVAVWYSEYDRMRRRDSPFRPIRNKGVMLDIILEGGRPADIIFDNVLLTDELMEYPVVIVPDSLYITDEHKKALEAYMEQGGKVIVCGKAACKAFVDVKEEFDEKQLFYFSQDGYMQGIADTIVTFPDDMEPLVNCYSTFMKTDAPKINVAAWKKWGKGEIYCFGWDVCADYALTKDQCTRNLFRDVLDKAEPEPWVCLESGIRRVEVLPTVKDGEMMAHIINTTELIMPGNIYTVSHNLDAFPPLHDLTIAIKCPKAPKCIMEEPTHKELEFTYDGKIAHVKLPALDVHSILIPKY